MSPTYPFQTGLVTGASSGIGKAIALRLGLAGVRVALVARRKPELEQIAHVISNDGGEALVFAADLCDAEVARESTLRAQAALGGIDLLVANAGMGAPGRLVDLAWAPIQQTFLLNVIAPIAMIHAALPAMLARKSGYIAGISSLASYRGFPASGAYSSSKAALSTFLESVRVQTRRQGVFVSDIHPGYVHTAMTEHHTRPLPFVMEADRAAALILRAIVRRRAVYNFPWQMALLLRVVRRMPPALYDRLAHRYTDVHGAPGLRRKL
jgi:short-subunit dehydrogenase